MLRELLSIVKKVTTEMASAGQDSAAAARLRDKFRGAMVGAVIGDALGAPLEFITNGNLSYKRVIMQFSVYNQEKKKNVRHYTDDTAMARQLALSLVNCKGLDESDLAKRFCAEYFREKDRGYGRGVIDVFQKLREEDCSEPFRPAEEQFDGNGSYGNGGAMRAHPVGLFCHLDKASLVETARKSAKVTHAHEEGILGAVLQACAVNLALDDGDDKMFLAELKAAAAGDLGFRAAMEKVEKCLAGKDDEAALELGNDVTALKSVPSAIYSFLRVRAGPVEGLEKEENEFSRTLQFAYSYGGDADTIGSMAGAIAGAFHGLRGIPEVLREQCEGVEEAQEMADQLFELVHGKSQPDETKPKL